MATPLRLDYQTPLNNGDKGAISLDPRLQAAKDLALDHACDAVRALIRNLNPALRGRNSGNVNTAAKYLLQFAADAIAGSADGAAEAIKVVVVDQSQLGAELAKRAKAV